MIAASSPIARSPTSTELRSGTSDWSAVSPTVAGPMPGLLEWHLLGNTVGIQVWSVSARAGHSSAVLDETDATRPPRGWSLTSAHRWCQALMRFLGDDGFGEFGQ